jgi:hypothetical protein
VGTRSIDKRWNKLILFGRQGPSKRRLAEQGLAELALELKETERKEQYVLVAAKQLATERAAEDCR